MKKRNLTIKDAGIAFVVAFLIAQLTAIVGVSIIKAIMQSCGKTTEQVVAFFDTAPGYLIQSLLTNIAFAGVFVWYARHLNKHELINKPNDKSIKYILICIVIGIATLFLLSGALNYFQLLVDKLGFESAVLGYELDSPSNYVISLISLAILPAICEELLFRGVLVNCLKSKGPMFAIIVSSVMFSIFHFSPSQLIYPFCFGLILSIVYLRTRNIIFPILLHFINNALSLSIQYFSNSSGTFVHSYSMLVYSIITLAVWISIIVWMFKDFKKSCEGNNEIAVICVEDTNQDSKTEQQNKMFLYGSIFIMICLYILLL